MPSSLDRIKEYLDHKGITVSYFEKSIGFSNGSFSNQLKKGKTIGVDKLEHILSVYTDLSAHWILTGKGVMLIENFDFNIPSKELDQIIKYKLHYMEFYLLGILEHVRTIQEDLKNIEYKEEKYIMESAYIKRFTGDPFEDKVPPYINYTPKEKFELIKELDKATMQYLDNIWLITMSLL